MSEFSGQVVTLEQLLQSRERRAARQKELLAAYSGVLLSFTVNYPGPVKLNKTVQKIHIAGARAIGRLFIYLPVLYNELVELPTGPEGYWVVDCPAKEAKRLACEVEEAHPLGRLFDIDVIGRDGVPLDRGALGLPGRRCLLCGKDPTLCRREGRHALEELTACIQQMADDYTLD